MTDFTPDRLQELRRIAEAVIEAHEGRRENACGAEDLFDRTFDPPTVLKLLDEIERLRNAAIDPGEYRINEPVVDWKRTAELRAQEIERLRRERETLAAAVRAWDDYAKTVIENGPLSFDAIDAMERAEQRHRKALALLDGEKGGGDDE